MYSNRNKKSTRSRNNIQREQGIGTPEQEKLMFKNMRLR
jgi:hypothetical protein